MCGSVKRTVCFLSTHRNVVLYISQKESVAALEDYHSPLCISVCKTCKIWLAQLSISGFMKTLEYLAGEASVLGFFFLFSPSDELLVMLSVVTHHLKSVCLSVRLSEILRRRKR